MEARDERGGATVHRGRNVSRVNIHQANEIGRVHAAKPQMKETYRGRTVNE